MWWRVGGEREKSKTRKKCAPACSAPRFAPCFLHGTPMPPTMLTPHPLPQHTTRGDPSADFALATFFPAPLVPAVERVSDIVSRITGLAAQAPTVLSAEVLGAPVLSEEAARRRYDDYSEWSARCVAHTFAARNSQNALLIHSENAAHARWRNGSPPKPVRRLKPKTVMWRPALDRHSGVTCVASAACAHRQRYCVR